MKAKLLTILCIITLVFGVVAAGCEGEVTPPAEEEEEEGQPQVFELSFADIHPYEDPMNNVLFEAWADWLEEESNGRIKMTLYHSCQAAKTSDHYDAARTGIVDIACQCAAMVPGRFNLIEVSMLPFVVTFPASRQTALMQTALYEKYPDIQAQFPDVKVLLFHVSGPSQILTVDKPIHTLEDLQGQMIISLGKYGTQSMSAFGGTPEFVDSMEMYDTLAKGVVDGAAVNWQAVYVFKLNEVTNYASDITFMMDTFFVHVMNLDTWNSLPPDLQELFVGENALNMVNIYGNRFDQDDMFAKEMLSEEYIARGYPGVYTIPDEERARWLEASLPVRDQWVSDAEAAGAPGRDILDDAIMFAEQYSYESLGPCDWCDEMLRDWGAPGY